jgi:hypothetical protein
MATRHFDKAAVGTIPKPFLPFSLLMSGFAAPLRLVHPQHSEAAGREADWPTSAFVDSGNIGRCVRWAFVIEAGAALAICTIWALCRLLW